MTGFITKPSCYETKRYIQKGELLIANTSEFDLTEGRVYVAMSDSIGESIFVVNDKGETLDYTTEYFCHYEGELVSIN